MKSLLDLALLANYLLVTVLVMTNRKLSIFARILLRKLVLIVSLLINFILFRQLIYSDNLADFILAALVNNLGKATSDNLRKVIIWMIKPLHQLISGNFDCLTVLH